MVAFLAGADVLEPGLLVLAPSGSPQGLHDSHHNLGKELPDLAIPTPAEAQPLNGLPKEAMQPAADMEFARASPDMSTYTVVDAEPARELPDEVLCAGAHSASTGLPTEAWCEGGNSEPATELPSLASQGLPCQASQGLASQASHMAEKSQLARGELLTSALPMPPKLEKANQNWISPISCKRLESVNGLPFVITPVSTPRLHPEGTLAAVPRESRRGAHTESAAGSWDAWAKSMARKETVTSLNGLPYIVDTSPSSPSAASETSSLSPLKSHFKVQSCPPISAPLSVLDA